MLSSLYNIFFKQKIPKDTYFGEKISTYIISLERAKDRRNKVNQLIKKYNNIKIFNAIDYKNDFIIKELQKKYNMKIDKGWAGCALSHICLYEKFLSSNDKYMLVLEDDCIIIKSLPTTNSEVERMFNEVNSSIEEIDMLYLTDRVYSLSFLNRRVIAGCGTEGYIIIKKWCKKSTNSIKRFKCSN